MCIRDRIFLVLALIATTGCRKDEEVLKGDFESRNTKFVYYNNWTETEKLFFTLLHEGNIQNRTVDPIHFYHPLMIACYNHLAKENETYHFIERIARNVGIADWENAYVFTNKFDQSNTFLLPLKGIQKNEVSGIISFNIVENKMIINAFSRNTVEESIKSSCKDYFIAESFDKFDKKIYGSQSSEMKDYYCACHEQNETVVNLPSAPCEWRLIRLCTDDRSQTGWTGYRPIYPPVWDHDMDGIMNDDDPDWIPFLNSYGGSITAAQDAIRNRWNNRLGDKLGSYDEFWDDDRNYFEFDFWNDFDFEFCAGCGQNWQEFLDSLFDWAWDRDHDNFWDWEDDDDDGNGWIDRYEDCPPPSDPIVKDGKTDKRTIRCDWYYVKDCNSNTNGPLIEWWNDFEELIDIPCEILDILEENQGEEYAQQFLDYINSSTTTHPCTGQPLNKEDFLNQICDPEMFNTWSNDQNFLLGGFLTPEVFIVLEYDEINNWANSHNNDPKATEIKNLALLKLCNFSTNPGVIIVGSGNDFNFPIDLYVVQRAIYNLLLAKHNLENPNMGCDRFCKMKLWLEAGYMVLIDPVHVALDICGLFPVLGEGCDGINGVLYLIQGDGINAAISFAATLPIGGWAATTGKYIAVAIKTSTGKTINLTVKIVGNFVDFGNRSDLRKVLELPVGDPRQAHHLISWSKLNHDVVQTAARGNHNSKSIYHMNRPNNGLAIEASRQVARPGEQAGHILYNDRVANGLEAIKNKFGLTNPDVLMNELGKYENYLRDLINDNPNLHLNDIVFTYIP